MGETPIAAGPDFDQTDRRILTLVQEDATLPVGRIAERVNLSQNACWRRIKLLEESGMIRRRVALLDAGLLGLTTTVFVSLKLVEHTPEALDRFARMVTDMPEAMEFHRITGEYDYLLKLQVANIAAYDRVYKRLIQSIRLADVRACFAMEVLKHTTALPVDGP